MIEVIAHRGASIDHPENSIAAIRRARDLGVDRVEIDVRLSRDGEVVVHHDHDLMRSAGTPLRVCETELRTLQGIELCYPGHPPCRMPTLAEAIEAAAPTPLCVEIKSDGDPRIERLADLTIAGLAGDDRSIVISFDDRVTSHALRRLPADRVGMIRNRDDSEDAWKDGIDAAVGRIVLSQKITSAEAISTLREAGRTVWAYALDDPESLTQHLAWGVDGVISNRPDVAVLTVRSWVSSENPGQL